MIIVAFKKLILQGKALEQIAMSICFQKSNVQSACLNFGRAKVGERSLYKVCILFPTVQKH